MSHGRQPSTAGALARRLPATRIAPCWRGIIAAAALVFPSLAHSAAPAAPAETGQTDCADASGAAISCTGTGQDGELRRGVPWPASRFANNGDGTVTDRLTGLTWLRDADCQVAQTDWPAAVSFANGLAHGACGLTDQSVVGAWRLPNALEIESLVDYARVDPALPSGHPFLMQDAEDGWWTSTTLAGDSLQAWSMDMVEGDLMPIAKSGNLRWAWPVRGEGRTAMTVDAGVQFADGTVQSSAPGTFAPLRATGQTTSQALGDDGDLEVGVAWPSPRFTAEMGVVIDHLTELTWLLDADCAGATTTWTGALDFANTLFDGSTAHNGGDCDLEDGSVAGEWHLPNLRELATLVDYGSGGVLPAAHPFSNLQLERYWTGNSIYTTSAWTIDMATGRTSPFFKSSNSRVWPVRATR